jgi:hypothetical protein
MSYPVRVTREEVSEGPCLVQETASRIDGSDENVTNAIARIAVRILSICDLSDEKSVNEL